LEKSVRLLAKIAHLYDLVVVMTNQVSSSPDSYSRDHYVSVGGNVLAYASKHRISLRSIGRNIHAKIISSPSLAPLDARFTVNELGVTDILTAIE